MCCSASLPFNDQVVIVTGGSRGIGRATAVAFAERGAKVVVNYRRDDLSARETLNRVESVGGAGLLYQADLNELKQIKRMVEEVENQFGKIDVLVNNAAAIHRTSFLDTEVEQFDQVWGTNVRGAFYLSQLAARSMVGQRKGCIVHVSSIGARLGVINMAAYCASKGAIESLTRCMAIDLAPFNVRVNAISPGTIRTEGLLDGMSDPSIADALASYIPGRRLGEPEEVANAIVFLASDEAGYINGTVLPVDGSLGAREAGFPYKT